jgi:ABC-2 type transport system ATP-binding protein
MLEIRGLTKRYRGVTAIDGVSFSLRPGEILGCLGPNGAGKSTTVKILIGLIEPTAGEIYFRGLDVRHHPIAFQRLIGYVPEEAYVYPHLTGQEHLQLAGRLRGLPRRILDRRSEELLRLFSLWEDRHSPLASYSKGMRQKVLLCGALLHNPELLILDEPFSGLDVHTALVLRTLLRRLADEGKMILYSSHVLDVVERICSSVMILLQGRIVAADRVERLRDLMQQPNLEGVFAELTRQHDPDELAAEILEAIRS